MTLENARNIATLVAAAIALVGIVPVFRNLIAAERNLRAKIYFDTINLLEGSDGDVRKLRTLLQAKLDEAKKTGVPFDITAQPTEVRSQLDNLSRAYDKVGLLVKHRVVPAEFLFDFYSRPIVVAWKSLRPHIDAERTSRGQPNHMVKFEILAAGAALYREKKYKESSPYSIPRHVIDSWAKWRPWRGGYRTSAGA